MKLCECGCGQPAPLAPRNRASKGIVKGEPLRFIKGHYKTSAAKPGHIKTHSTGYKMIKIPKHPYANKSGYVMYHRWILEKRLGYYLNPKKYHVHHIDFDKTNNNATNLIAIRHKAHNRLHALAQHSERRKNKCNLME